MNNLKKLITIFCLGLAICSNADAGKKGRRKKKAKQKKHASLAIHALSSESEEEQTPQQTRRERQKQLEAAKQRTRTGDRKTRDRERAQQEFAHLQHQAYLARQAARERRYRQAREAKQQEAQLQQEAQRQREFLMQQETLAKLISSGNIEEALKFFEQMTNGQPDNNGWTFLHYVARYGSLKLIYQLTLTKQNMVIILTQINTQTKNREYPEMLALGETRMLLTIIRIAITLGIMPQNSLIETIKLLGRNLDILKTVPEGFVTTRLQQQGVHNLQFCAHLEQALKSCQEMSKTQLAQMLKKLIKIQRKHHGIREVRN